MKNDLKKYRKILIAAQVILIATCIFIFIFDYIFGNGDGIINQLKLEPFSLILIGQIFLLPFIGMTSSKKNLANTSVFVFTLILVFIVLEILLRTNPIVVTQSTWTENIGNTKSIVSKYDSIYFKNYIPHAEFLTHVKELDTSFSILNTINSQGIRGPEIEKKQEGIQRILLLGDSYIQADEVAFNHTIGQQLGKMLGDSFEVIQHGQSSWSPILELNWLMKKGKNLDIDQVILFTYYNDFMFGNGANDLGYSNFAQFDSKGFPTSFNFSMSKNEQKRNAWILFNNRIKNSGTYRYCSVLFNKWFIYEPFSNDDIEMLFQVSPEKFQDPQFRAGIKNKHLVQFMDFIALARDTSLWNQLTNERFALSENYLFLMNEWLTNQNIKLSIAHIPNPFQFEAENLGVKTFYGFDNFVYPASGLEQRVNSFCKKNEIPFIPLYSAFAQFKKEHSEPLYFYYDSHWNPNGHRLAAETVFHFLNSSTVEPDE